MKLYTRLCSLLLAGAMLFSLTACSNKDTEPDTPAPSDTSAPAESPAPSTGVLPADFVPDTSVEDLCLAVTGIPGSSELLSVNGMPVTAYSYLYWLTYNGYYLTNFLSSYGLPLDWNQDPNLATSLKEAALSNAMRYSLVASKAKTLGFDMTQAQIDELNANFALAIESVGGNEVFLNELRIAGLDYDAFYEIQAAAYYYTQLLDGLFPDRPTAEEMDAYIAEKDLLRAKHILLATVDTYTREPLDEATIAQKKATAEDILSQLQASDDLIAAFDALMFAHSEDSGLISNPDGYVFTAGEMVAEFESATRALEFGEISGLVESPYGYHIILRLDPGTEDIREECRNDLLSQQLAAWADEAEVILSEEYDALDAALCFEKYMAYQDAFAEELAAEAQDAP